MILGQFLCIIVVVLFGSASAGSKSKPHVHQGVIEPYDGKPLPIHLTQEQELKLEKGEAVRDSLFTPININFYNLIALESYRWSITNEWVNPAGELYYKTLMHPLQYVWKESAISRNIQKLYPM